MTMKRLGYLVLVGTVLGLIAASAKKSSDADDRKAEDAAEVRRAAERRHDAEEAVATRLRGETVQALNVMTELADFHARFRADGSTLLVDVRGCDGKFLADLKTQLGAKLTDFTEVKCDRDPVVKLR